MKKKQHSTLAKSSRRFSIGTGNWGAFPHDRVTEVLNAAETWRRGFSGIERPWLCWCVNDDWCILQQRLVQSCGWTPVVGTDGRVARPTVLKGSVFVDFNAGLRLPVMWMHFPLEFVFAFSDRLAFWHSDVLPPVGIMKLIAAEFDGIQPGEYIGVFDDPGLWMRLRRVVRGILWRQPRKLRNWNAKRWFEAIGCTTAEASRQQFECGCGIWRYIDRHPNASVTVRAALPHYEHGVGIRYWEVMFGGRARKLSVDIDPYHYVTKGKLRTRNSTGQQEKGMALQQSFQLKEIARTLGLPAPFDTHANDVEESPGSPSKPLKAAGASSSSELFPS
jgi:hypothetical protein